MTETPEQPDKEESRADKNWTPDENDKLPRVDGTAERIKRWQDAQAEAERTGNTTSAEYYKAMLELERIRAAKGPNPTQEKARTLYEHWQSGCGGADPLLKQMTQDMRSWANLHPYEQARWAVLAKALGGLWIDGQLCHDLTPVATSHTAQDAMRYKDIPADLSWAEYDDVLNPKDPGYQKLRQHWWQLWRPRHEKLTTSSAP
jgi:hypothetical protein